MRKLALKLDDLSVESFDTSPGRRRTRGTVRGNGGTEDDWTIPYDEYDPFALDPIGIGGDLEYGTKFPCAGPGSDFPCDTIDIVKCPPKLPPPPQTFYKTCVANQTCNYLC